MLKVKLSNLIAPSFYDMHKKIKEDRYTHIWLKGGRGSTKSSFVSVEVVFGMIKDSLNGVISNAVVIRRVKDTLRESVYEQICWAIYELGVQEDWYIPDSKLKMIYKPTGQVILFKGADNPKKLKSIKVAKGYIKYVWYEEVDEFENKEKIDNINQSLLRGGPKYKVFYSFNPPESQRNWCNREVIDEREDKVVSHTDYRSVPSEWLGSQFLIEAEEMKNKKPRQYEHDFLGKVTGTGRDVFDNLSIRRISDEEIKTFDRINNGVDWGWYPDPWAFIKCYYNASTRDLYIFEEDKANRKSNLKTAEILKNNHGITLHDFVICDSSENKSIEDYRAYGIRAVGAEKGPGSVDYSMKWLQSLHSIIIDPVRCPNATKEYQEYEYDIDKNDEVINEYPDKNNHFIDATRYSTEKIWKRRGK